MQRKKTGKIYHLVFARIPLSKLRGTRSLPNSFLQGFTNFKSKMILRRLGGGDEAYFTRVTFRLYVEEADNDTNKNSALI
jgi:hypothetical protein